LDKAAAGTTHVEFSRKLLAGVEDMNNSGTIRYFNQVEVVDFFN